MALEEALVLGRTDSLTVTTEYSSPPGPSPGGWRRLGVTISMNGQGRVLDSTFVERLWRSVKYGDIYLKGYRTMPELDSGLEEYFWFYSHERPHRRWTIGLRPRSTSES